MMVTKIKFITLLITFTILMEACGLINLQKISYYPKTKKVSKPAKIVSAPPVEGMVFIPGGTFKMGSTRKANEGPVHTVTVKGFYLDKTEVTVAEYYRFCKATKRRMPEQPEWSEDDHPVVNVDWRHARAYARWVGKRLPTEAEWEYAARGTAAGTGYTPNPKTRYKMSYGNIADESLLQIKLRFPIKRRYDDGYIHTAPVASFPSNIFGVYDMEGNVLEWCSDWYSAGYYKKSPSKNPKGPAKGNYKVIRGASWNRSGMYLRSTFRSWYPPACAFNFLGFRCAKSLK